MAIIVRLEICHETMIHVFFFEESRNKVFLQLLTIVKHNEKMNHIFTFIEYIWMKYGIFGVEIRDEQGNGNFSNYS